MIFPVASSVFTSVHLIPSIVLVPIAAALAVLGITLPTFMLNPKLSFSWRWGSAISKSSSKAVRERTSSEKEQLAVEVARGDCDCPYEYILQVYGKHHFTTLVNVLNSQLKTQDPIQYQLILDIMDAVHFGAILVDDVADNSVLRKGKLAAHKVYGSSETINRAYLRIFEVIENIRRQRPAMIPFILQNLTEIHEGQDISLVWRRDGFQQMPDQESALKLYRHSAYLKTGALFRLVGQLVFGNHDQDEVMSAVGWYCHLQNDCKNVYSSDVIKAKGALAEDLVNGEYSFPVIVALHSSLPERVVVQQALGEKGEVDPALLDQRHQAALAVLQAKEVKDVCMKELDSLKRQVPQFAAIWGRQETMTLKDSSDGR